jgi:hypothetical protein
MAPFMSGKINFLFQRLHFPIIWLQNDFRLLQKILSQTKMFAFQTIHFLNTLQYNIIICLKPQKYLIHFFPSPDTWIALSHPDNQPVQAYPGQLYKIPSITHLNPGRNPGIVHLQVKATLFFSIILE